jgi:AraC-like DNA-binding protein
MTRNKNDNNIELDPQYMKKTIEWTPEQGGAAELLAEAYTVEEVADRVGVSPRTIHRWKANPEFAMEVDRLSLISGLSSKAERARTIMKAARNFQNEDGSLNTSGNTLLEYLREARMNVDGIRLDLQTAIAALDAENSSVAGEGPAGSSELLPPETDEPD